MLLIVTAASAQNQKVSNPKSKQSYVQGAFDEVIGQYQNTGELDSLTSDTSTYYIDLKNYKTLIIKKDSILFGGITYIHLITNETKPRRHQYWMTAYIDNDAAVFHDINRSIDVYMNAKEKPWWFIQLTAVTDSGRVMFYGNWEKKDRVLNK